MARMHQDGATPARAPRVAALSVAVCPTVSPVLVVSETTTRNHYERSAPAPAVPPEIGVNRPGHRDNGDTR